MPIVEHRLMILVSILDTVERGRVLMATLCNDCKGIYIFDTVSAVS